ncbi:PREDICTED: uncharacterized protein LOC105115911 [Populus euphratica]|uniref:Uncharacterized protein LOC105115911 n=1 Tax=Populus euphratica TaxID=75702 RepID=A0AAJ6TI78_POPEU|nr:PREDICTED: uncharacterized protein LOC105115911 [Populus euphratica]
MAENSSSGGSSMASAPARSDDPAWAHGQVVVGGQVEACKKVPPDVKWQMKQLIEDLTMEKEKRKRLRIDIRNSQSLSNNEVKEGDSTNPTLSDIGSQANKRLTMQGTSANRKKTTLFVPRNTPNSQPSIKSAMASKEKEHNTRKVIARWWYNVNVPFNGAKSYYYRPIIDAIASMGHDGWSNRRNVPVVNFLAYSPRGTIFLKLVDTSGLRKDTETLLEMFDEIVKEMGQENIIQFVSDNESAFKAAGKALQQRYGTFFWSPYAAHCIDLMLET